MFANGELFCCQLITILESETEQACSALRPHPPHLWPKVLPPQSSQ